jgi:hypothetical protein
MSRVDGQVSAVGTRPPPQASDPPQARADVEGVLDQLMAGIFR